MTNYISTPLSTLNEDLNTIQSTLSSKADKSEIPEVPEDLSSFTNSPGYATSAYVQEYVDEHGGGTPSNLSDYVAISALNDIYPLAQDATSADMLSTINALIDALKGTQPEPPVDPRKTRVVYNNNTTADFDIVGTLNSSSIPNITSIKKVDLGNTVTEIATDTFKNCSYLESITIPDSCSTIGSNIFDNCTSLKECTLPNTVSSTGGAVFRGCTSLSSVNLGNSLTAIASQLFKNCTSLSTIVVPDTVTSVWGDYNFQSTPLVALDFGSTRSTIPSLERTNAFQNVSTQYQIRVPNTLLDTWKATSVWSNFASHFVGQ